MSDSGATETDVVVVGGGGAGLAAAIEAASFGARVVLLEKNEAIGGTTGRSVGSITASCTDIQRAKGIFDSPEAHFADLTLFARDLAPKDNLELRRVQVENAPGTVAWLQGLGIVFFGPMPEPPHKQPRMHNILPHSRSYIHHLSKRARQLRVEIRTGTRVRGLIKTGERVSGVTFEAGGTTRQITARRGVILAAGDYSADSELKARYLAPDVAIIDPINTTATGDGHRIVLEAGGSILNGEVLLGPEIRFVAPPRRTLMDQFPSWKPVALAMRTAMQLLPSFMLRPFLMMFVTTNLQPSNGLFGQGAILINKNGARFCDERDAPTLAIAKQPDRVSWILLDAKIAAKFESWPNFISTAPGIAYAYLADYKRNRKDITFEAPTLAELAAKLGVPPARLVEAVDAHNATVPAGLPRLDTPPYTALGPAKSCITATDGGARISTRMEVLDAAGAPIAGLYAAGSNGQGGLLVEGHGHHLGWAFTSGRIAGRTAALSGFGERVKSGPAQHDPAAKGSAV